MRSLRERLSHFSCGPEIVKCALTEEDVKTHDLPPAPAKKADTRREGYVAEHGDRCVELDALPPEILRERIVREVEARMDLNALHRTLEAEKRDRKRLSDALARLREGQR